MHHLFSAQDSPWFSTSLCLVRSFVCLRCLSLCPCLSVPPALRLGVLVSLCLPLQCVCVAMSLRLSVSLSLSPVFVSHVSILSLTFSGDCACLCSACVLLSPPLRSLSICRLTAHPPRHRHQSPAGCCRWSRCPACARRSSAPPRLWHQRTRRSNDNNPLAGTEREALPPVLLINRAARRSPSGHRHREQRTGDAADKRVQLLPAARLAPPSPAKTSPCGPGRQRRCLSHDGGGSTQGNGSALLGVRSLRAQSFEVPNPLR